MLNGYQINPQYKVFTYYFHLFKINTNQDQRSPAGTPTTVSSYLMSSIRIYLSPLPTPWLSLPNRDSHNQRTLSCPSLQAMRVTVSYLHNLISIKSLSPRVFINLYHRWVIRFLHIRQGIDRPQFIKYTQVCVMGFPIQRAVSSCNWFSQNYQTVAVI